MQVERGRKPGVNPSVSASDSNGFFAISMPSTSSSSPPPVANYIEHQVSKMDTLAGVAIKYGVEVADVKKMNGLVTDLQMFAHKSLQIPLPGRHPPSPILANGYARNGISSSYEMQLSFCSSYPVRSHCKEQTSPLRSHGDVLDSFQSLKLKPPLQRKVSPAMSNLQGYYGLTPPRRGPLAEGTEMAVYRTGKVLFSEDEAPSSGSNHHNTTRSSVNGYSPENGKLIEDATIIEVGEGSESDRANSESSVRRRQKTDIYPFSRILGKGLAPRPKTGSHTDNDITRPHLSSASTGDSSMANGFLSVRKSSSTSNLQESENTSSVWTPWNLKPDVIARPIFDGLPKPMSVRRAKAALD